MRALSVTPDRRERAVSLATLLLFASMAVLAAVDLIADLGEGTTPGHVAIEGMVVIVGIGGALWMTSRLRGLAREAQELRALSRGLAADLDAAREESDRWRVEAADLITGLGAAIDRQLDRWGLTPAEKEIALLLLKGLSHKEIAAIREVGETTVRQQARALYRKAGLGGRHDLAAFFLEDLLDPRAAG